MQYWQFLCSIIQNRKPVSLSFGRTSQNQSLLTKFGATKGNNMKKTGIWLLLLMFVAGSAFAEEGVEEGDLEISFFGMYTKGTGDLDVSFGMIQVRMGKYFTDKLLLGVAPGLQIFDAGGYSSTDATFEVFSAYNFSTASRTIPYVKGSLNQTKTDIPDNQDFLDYAFLQAGFGVKNFFNEYAALDTSIAYGFSIGQGPDSGNLMLLSGITFVF
jgi:hypothetical protein